MIVSYQVVSLLGTQRILVQSMGNDGLPPGQSGMTDYEMVEHCYSQKHIPELKINTAYLCINSSIDFEVDIFAQTTECHQCALMYYLSIPKGGSSLLRVNTSWPTEIVVTSHNETHIYHNNRTVCRQTEHFGQSGYYVLWVNPNPGDTYDDHFVCNIVESKRPVDIYIPIYVAIVIYIAIAALYLLVRFLRKKELFLRMFETERLVNSDLGSPTSLTASTRSESMEPKRSTEKPRSQRLKSLDTFRGISIVIMIFVNLGGGEYWFFQHSRWNGLTVADLVFPWFVFIMGTSIVLAFNALLKKGASKGRLFFKIVKRTIILFALGLILDTGKDRSGVDLSTIRIPGVLQRFSICYFVVATVELLTAKVEDPYKFKFYSALRDQIHLWLHWIVAICLLTLYMCLLFLLPVPGCPTGYLGPGGQLLFNESGSTLENCTGGATGYIDKIIFGESHIYPHPTCKDIYQTGPYDPEGILGSITAILITFMGLLAGKILLLFTDWKRRVRRWLMWAVITGIIAGVLCNFQKNDGWIPVNKNLWSLSYILALASMSFLLLSVLYYVVDVQSWWSGAPFYHAGMNSILLYCGHEIMRNYFPWQWKTGQTHAEELASDLVGTSLWLLTALYLHRKKVFLKI
ncbi:heparan-alpha-glucosaminide N-acetyltransferase-like [Glandiceps talaboti]